MKVKLVPKASGKKWRRPPSLPVDLHKPYLSGADLSGEDTNEKEWKEALRLVEVYDKMVQKWIKLLDQGRKLAAKRYEVKLLVVRQLALNAMAKADRA